MLARSVPARQAEDEAQEDGGWKRELAQAITRPEQLLTLLGLDHRQLAGALGADRQFRLLVPRGFVALMERGNPRDPLLRQVLPLGAELLWHQGFCADPVGDQAAQTAPGLLCKYPGRALMVVTGACAVHCRYCFRRHFPYVCDQPMQQRWAEPLARIAADSATTEVILSGGDPLMLDDAFLGELLTALDAIPHITRLRLHTRMPVVLPARVTQGLCRLIARRRARVVVVVHVNHARELGPAARGALDRLFGSGAQLLNQSVLLAGVNDRVEDLADLSDALFQSRVLPYYLHLLDRVAGAAHFEVSEDAARGLLDGLRVRLPGYLVPRLVREVAGAPHKIPLGG